MEGLTESGGDPVECLEYDDEFICCCDGDGGGVGGNRQPDNDASLDRWLHFGQSQHDPPPANGRVDDEQLLVEGKTS